MLKRPFEAIIFDHDGTLIDTETADYKACQLLCQEIGVSLAQEFWAERMLGRMDGYETLFVELIQIQNRDFNRTKMWNRLKELWQITRENIGLMPGVSTLLHQLQTGGYPMGVATASDRAWADRWLTHFNLRAYFQVVATSNDIINNKPAPDVYLFAASRLGVPPEHCLVFEDSLAGTQAAKAAGMRVIAVFNHANRGLNFSDADGVIESLGDVMLPLVEQWAKSWQESKVVF
jgi:HAD superfamily hydrolase (TIGR01509 family)